jgi:hypothetical protein
MNKQILSVEKINKIVDQANQTGQDDAINIQVEEALIAMLKITYFFKSEMDRKSLWSQNLEIMEEKADHFYEVTGWKGMERGKNKINADDLLLFHTDIQNLLLQTLYALNGSNYSANDRAYDLESVFDKIFEGVPNGKEFDIEIIRFLLLPMYNTTHNTNYQTPEMFPASL